MSGETNLTPMMAQYRQIKASLPKGALLLFRLGDFYELFFEDAVTGAQLLNVALTRRGTTPMCGIPYHAASGYIARILKSGNKVAICDQMEEARPGKLVKREVTQILSPGTHFDERMLRAERNNYLAAVYALNKSYGLAFVDLTTGDFATTEVGGEAPLLAELERQRPAEIIIPSESQSLKTLLQPAFPVLTGYDDWVFAPETSFFTVKDHFKVASLDGFGLRERSAAVGAAGAALHYLAQSLHRDVAHLTRISFYHTADFLVLDAISLKNLEILEPLHRDAPSPASLYDALRRTVTPMGSRRLRDWLSQPLSSAEDIRRRQDAVQTWIGCSSELENFRKLLAEVRDMERTIARLSSGSGNARDLLALRTALEQVPAIQKLLGDLQNNPTSAGLGSSIAQETLLPAPAPDSSNENIIQDAESNTAPSRLIATLASQLTELPDLVELIAQAIIDEPPLALKEGGLIRDGFDSALDEVRKAMREGKDWIAQLQQRECERTGIPSLKVRFNSVFGYYIEITKSNLEKTPPDYIRKQTIANGERFITPELKDMEGKILGAEERCVQREYDLFQQVREAAVQRLAQIQQTAMSLAQLDVLASFAETARLHSYCRPDVGDEGVVKIIDGRHPVLEQSTGGERFVPNDIELNLNTQQIMLITGPNMAGKSTFLRQAALLVLLAHTGSFIPAKEARIDLVDRIFTRIGASDDLSRGQSTFMVEMSETANLLNNSSSRSLIVLDEVGRGTSTFDGLSLAWSIVEYLHGTVGAKTLFATHYHELTELAARLPKLKNFNVAVREWNDQIIFLRKILPGGTDKSYGIQVARLAGVPKPILDRAKVILQNLEASELTPEGSVRAPSRHRAEREKLKNLPPPQLELF